MEAHLLEALLLEVRLVHLMLFQHDSAVTPSEQLRTNRTGTEG